MPKSQKQLNQNNNHELNHVFKTSTEPTSLTNENFSFTNEYRSDKAGVCLNQSELNQNKTLPLDDADRKLQSPVESHFAVTPVTNSETSSPANGFINQDSTDLLKEELDQLDKDSRSIESLPLEEKIMNRSIQSLISFDTLLSPTDENISMFSRSEDQPNTTAVEDCSVGDTFNTKNIEQEDELVGEVSKSKY